MLSAMASACMQDLVCRRCSPSGLGAQCGHFSSNGAVCVCRRSLVRFTSLIGFSSAETACNMLSLRGLSPLVTTQRSAQNEPEDVFANLSISVLRMGSP